MSRAKTDARPSRMNDTLFNDWFLRRFDSFPLDGPESLKSGIIDFLKSLTASFYVKRKNIVYFSREIHCD